VIVHSPPTFMSSTIVHRPYYRYRRPSSSPPGCGTLESRFPLLRLLLLHNLAHSTCAHPLLRLNVVGHPRRLMAPDLAVSEDAPKLLLELLVGELRGRDGREDGLPGMYPLRQGGSVLARQ